MVRVKLYGEGQASYMVRVGMVYPVYGEGGAV